MNFLKLLLTFNFKNNKNKARLFITIVNELYLTNKSPIKYLDKNGTFKIIILSNKAIIL
jgi:hypothetical protein